MEKLVKTDKEVIKKLINLMGEDIPKVSNLKNRPICYASKNSKVTGLSLCHSNLIELPKYIGFLTSLKKLNLSKSSELRELPNSFLILKSLTSLDISFCKIIKFSGRLNKRFDLSPYDIIIFGHVHRPYNEVWRDGKLYLNPGTPTDKRFTDINSYGYLRISNDKVEPEIIYL